MLPRRIHRFLALLLGLLSISVFSVRAFPVPRITESKRVSRSRSFVPALSSHSTDAGPKLGEDNDRSDESGSDDASSQANNRRRRRRRQSSNQPNYYDILRVSPDATQPELKRSYVALARKTHPDALIGREPGDVAADDLPEFQQVSEAWKTLSDPIKRKRYDRIIQTDKFVEETGKWAGKVGESAGQVWGDVGAPLFKRANNFAQEYNKEATVDVSVSAGQVFMSAVEAAKRAGRNINRADMMDKRDELMAKADEEETRAASIRADIASVNKERLRLVLRVPNSALSSLEAMQILDGFNTDDRRTIMDFAAMRQTVTAEIAALEKAEASYYDRFDDKTKAETRFLKTQESLKQAKINAESAAQAAVRARQALKAAQELVRTTTKALEDQTDSFADAEIQFMKTVEDTEHLASGLERRQERARKALLRKEEAIVKDKVVSGEALEPEEKENSEGTLENNLKKMEELKKRERFLMAEGTRVGNRAARLRSRADALKARADFTVEDIP